MATTNPVFQVLVTKGNLPLLPADKKLEELTPGQMGVFNFHTNLSVDGTVLPTVREVYLAVGLDRDNDGVTDDVLKSAGQMIQRENIRGYNSKCYAPAKPKIIELTGFSAKCETEYGIKIEVRNQLGYLLNGYNQVAKSFIIKTSCCTQEDCVSCPQGDCNEIAIKLKDAINLDPEQLMKAELISGPGGSVITDPTAFATGIKTLGTITPGASYTNGSYINVVLTGGTGSGAKANITVAGGVVTAVTITNAGTGYVVGNNLSVAAATIGGTGSGFSIPVTAINEDVCLGLRITSIPMAVKKFCSVNLGYFNPRGTDVIVSTVAGFECNGTITEVQDLQFEEGLGYDIAQLEYEAGGWNGKPGPYRNSTLAGMPIESFESYVDQTAKYQEVNLIYDQFSVGGWLEYLNNLNTIIAIPCADTVTRANLATFLDRIFGGVGGFGPLADDMALCNCQGAGTPTSAIDNPNQDGIG